MTRTLLVTIGMLVALPVMARETMTKEQFQRELAAGLKQLEQHYSQNVQMTLVNENGNKIKYMANDTDKRLESCDAQDRALAVIIQKGDSHPRVASREDVNDEFTIAPLQTPPEFVAYWWVNEVPALSAAFTHRVPMKAFETDGIETEIYSEEVDGERVVFCNMHGTSTKDETTIKHHFEFWADRMFALRSCDVYARIVNSPEGRLDSPLERRFTSEVGYAPGGDVPVITSLSATDTQNGHPTGQETWDCHVASVMFEAPAPEVFSFASLRQAARYVPPASQVNQHALVIGSLAAVALVVLLLFRNRRMLQAAVGVWLLSACVTYSSGIAIPMIIFGSCENGWGTGVFCYENDLFPGCAIRGICDERLFKCQWRSYKRSTGERGCLCSEEPEVIWINVGF